MTAPAIQKVCRLCKQSCADRPRVKDQRGCYFCRSCYDLAIARKRAMEAQVVASSSASAMVTKPTAPAVAGTLPSVTPPASPAALPHASSPELPPALPRTGRTTLPVTPSPIIVPVVQPAANPIGPERQLIAEPAAREAPALEPPSPFMAEPIAPAVDWHRADDSPPAVDSLLDDGDAARTPPPEPSSFELESEPIEYVFDNVRSTETSAEPSTRLTAEEAVNSVDAQALDEPVDLAQAVAATSAPSPPASPPIEPARNDSPSESLLAGESNGHVIQRVRSARSMLLDDEPPPVAFAACPHCSRPLPTGAIVCLACGFNVLSGEMSNEDTDRPPPRPRPRSGWAGPLLIASGLMVVALGAGYVLFGTRLGLVVFAAAAILAVPAWFTWAMTDARNTEGAQLKILVVPGYVFAWVYGESRSRYLRAVTVAVVTIAVLTAAMFYQWRQIEREHSRALLDQRARASNPG